MASSLSDRAGERAGRRRAAGEQVESRRTFRSIEFRKRYPYTMRLGMVLGTMAVIAGGLVLLSRIREARERGSR